MTVQDVLVATDGGTGPVRPDGRLVITGWGVVSALGLGAENLLAAVRGGRLVDADVSGMFEEDLPGSSAPVAVELDWRAALGGKGLRVIDRGTGITMLAADAALDDALPGAAEGPNGFDDVGVVLGTTAGNVKSTVDFSRESLRQEKPYHVNPALFPNTAMNSAAGRTAIRHQLRGPNATVGGGPAATLTALAFASRSLRMGDARMLLAGSVEEFSPHTAWAAHLTGSAHPAGEGAALFATTLAPAGAQWDDGAGGEDAEVLAVRVRHIDTGNGSDRARVDAVAALVRWVLDRAEVRVEDLWAAAPTSTGGLEGAALHEVLGGAPGPRVFDVRSVFGQTFAAAGALQLATVLAHHRTDSSLDGRTSLLTALSPDGFCAAAVVRGRRRPR